MMTSADIDKIISTLGLLLKTGQQQVYETTAKQEADGLNAGDMPYLKSKFHQSPPVHPEMNKAELRLGEWMAICQYAIFELLYHSYEVSLPLIRETAFGAYDWTQATALEVLCRLVADRKLPEEVLSEISTEMEQMRYETHLYLGQGLLYRSQNDQRFGELISKLDNNQFRKAIEKLKG